MAGLVPAIHVVRRSEGSQAIERGEKLCVRMLLLLGPLTSDSSLTPRGVDGRDEPGHDGGGSRATRQRCQSTANAIRASKNFRRPLAVDNENSPT